MRAPSGRQHEVTGLVLAGGQGRRMGGRDKGLLRCRGELALCRSLASLRSQLGPVLISANRHGLRYRVLGACAVVADRLGDGDLGPLAGLHALASRVRTPWVQLLAVDVLSIPSGLVARQLRLARRRGGCGVMPHDGRRVQPLFALMRRSCLLKLAAQLERQCANGELAGAVGWRLRSLGVGVFRWRPSRVRSGALWRNLNHPDDWRRGCKRGR